jgi:hypothetical protein
MTTGDLAWLLLIAEPDGMFDAKTAKTQSMSRAKGDSITYG